MNVAALTLCGPKTAIAKAVAKEDMSVVTKFVPISVVEIRESRLFFSAETFFALRSLFFSIWWIVILERDV